MASGWHGKGGMSYIKTDERFNASHSVIVRLKQRVNQTGSVKERQRTGKPLKTTPKEDTLLKRLARHWPFSTANTLRSRWIVNRRISRRTLNRRLTNTKFRAKASATDNTPQNNQALMDTWSYGMEYQVVAESALVRWKLFLLTPVDGSVRVWRPRNTAFLLEHIVCITAFGGAGVTVWGCFSLNCKLDLYVLDGTLTGQKYRDQTLCPLVVPHFDCHPLTSRPILMDANVRPHRACIVQN
jgi:transposase